MKVPYVALYNFDSSTPAVDVQAIYDDGVSSWTTYTATVSLVGLHTYEAVRAAISAFIVANAPTTITDADIQYPLYSPAFASIKNAPQAAIANAPADAVTNYNIVTTLLGTLTSAVNAANTKQNDIATKLNTLLAELRTLGLISV